MDVCPLAGNKTKVPAMPSLAVFPRLGWRNPSLDSLMRNQWVHCKKTPEAASAPCSPPSTHTHMHTMHRVTSSMCVSCSLCPASHPLTLHGNSGGFLDIFRGVLLHRDKHCTSCFEIKIKSCLFTLLPYFLLLQKELSGSVCACAHVLFPSTMRRVWAWLQSWSRYLHPALDL